MKGRFVLILLFDTILFLAVFTTIECKLINLNERCKMKSSEITFYSIQRMIELVLVRDDVGVVYSTPTSSRSKTSSNIRSLRCIEENVNNWRCKMKSSEINVERFNQNYLSAYIKTTWALDVLHHHAWIVAVALETHQFSFCLLHPRSV